MSAASALARGRRMAESLMVETWQVTRIDADEDGNPILVIDDHGAVTQQRSTVYDGPAKKQTQSASAQSVVAGGHQFTVQRTSLHFPTGSFQMNVGDRAECLASPFPMRVGQIRRLTQEAPFKTFETAYRVFTDGMPA